MLAQPLDFNCSVTPVLELEKDTQRADTRTQNAGRAVPTERVEEKTLKRKTSRRLRRELLQSSGCTVRSRTTLMKRKSFKYLERLHFVKHEEGSALPLRLLEHSRRTGESGSLTTLALTERFLFSFSRNSTTCRHFTMFTRGMGMRLRTSMQKSHSSALVNCFCGRSEHRERFRGCHGAAQRSSSRVCPAFRRCLDVLSSLWYSRWSPVGNVAPPEFK